MDYILNIAKKSKSAFESFSFVKTKQKNEFLEILSENINKNMDLIIQNNIKDLEEYTKKPHSNIMLKRLILDQDGIKNICQNINKIIHIEDPVGIIEFGKTTVDELNIVKKRVPFGVVGMIYESRPNVTIDASCLSIKSGNCCILKGGKEAINTNKSLVHIIKDSLRLANIHQDVVSLIEDNSREHTESLIKLDKYIDLIIPRGGKDLIEFVKKNSNVPIIETGTGNCHIFVDQYADFKMAEDIILNSKLSKPYVCNALESLVVHKDIASKFIPIINKNFIENNIDLICCEESYEILKGSNNVSIACESDFFKEFLDYKISLKIVSDISSAIHHINKYSTKHSECIITNSIKNANLFTNSIDSAVVYVNASTRFTDGEKFGFGSEIGISTQKLHSRGPMGLKELTTTKYIVIGDGQTI